MNNSDRNCYWREGLLSESLYLIQFLDKQVGLTEETIYSSFLSNRFSKNKIKILLDMCLYFSWAQKNQNGKFSATDLGTGLLDLDPIARLRSQIVTMIESSPVIGRASVWGRNNLKIYLTIDQRECFRVAGLFKSVDEDVVQWWDDIRSKYRDSDSCKVEIGRKGEKLSYDFEDARVGNSPEWVALDNDSLGYDLISQISSDNETSLYIEAKASERSLDMAEFHFSRNEWDTLNRLPNVQVHLWWLFGSHEKHFILSIEELRVHVPVDKGAGKWKEFRCPFRLFFSDGE